MIIMMNFNMSPSYFHKNLISLFWGLFNDETDLTKVLAIPLKMLKKNKRGIRGPFDFKTIKAPELEVLIFWSSVSFQRTHPKTNNFFPVLYWEPLVVRKLSKSQNQSFALVFGNIKHPELEVMVFSNRNHRFLSNWMNHHKTGKD
jgi:hypothetical protein